MAPVTRQGKGTNPPGAPAVSARSHLYLPADRLDRLPNALASGAHRVILDLEDGVASSRKDEARRSVSTLDPGVVGGGVPIAVRIDNTTMELDVAAAASAGLGDLVLPKAEMVALERLAAHLEAAPPSILWRVTALIESARGLFDALALAEHPLVTNLALGEADLRADLGVTAGSDEIELIMARSTVVAAGAAAGLAAPTGPVAIDIDDLDALVESCRRLARLGFGGRSAIHPSQVAIINDAFAPSSDEVARARAIVSAFDAAVADGHGAARAPDGSMIDEAVVRSARRTLGSAG